jgi:hypothetical protein
MANTLAYFDNNSNYGRKEFYGKGPWRCILFQLILSFHVYPIELATTSVGFSRH